MDSKAYWRENNGRVPAFGGITGYVLVLVAGYGGFDFGLPFSIIGHRAGAMQKIERLSVATLETRRGDVSLTGMLKDSSIRVERISQPNIPARSPTQGKTGVCFGPGRTDPIEPHRTKGRGSGASNRSVDLGGGCFSGIQTIRAATAAIDRRANARGGCQ